MTVADFINEVLITEYKQLLDKGFHYILFALIGLGIEFLGACLDAYDFDKRGQSTARIRLAINTLFPAKYHSHSFQLCAELRNGFAHQFRPGSHFVLTHRAESTLEGTTHLGLYNKQTVLIAEDLYEDFHDACKQVLSMISAGALIQPKLHKQFLSITSPAGEMNIGVERIRERAYQLYEARGRKDGHALDDWLRAEKEIVAATT